MRVKVKNKPKILLVDDEPANLELLYRTLYRDYQVFQATNGMEALEILAQESEIAVIVSDQRMPLMSGTELLSLTATQYPDMIRIILTAYTDVEDLVDAINSGKVFKYVTKPWKTEELRTLVSQAVDTHNVLTARTKELCRTLRQESLLNAVTNTIRSRTTEAEILQTIVETVGTIFEVNYCILRPFQDGQLTDELFVYQRKKDKLKPLRNGTTVKNREKPAQSPLSNSSPPSSPTAEDSVDRFPESLLVQTIWETTEIEVINDVETDEKFQPMTPEIQQRRQTYQALGIRSSLVVPLIFRLDMLAVMVLHQTGSPRNWQDDEVQLGFMVADQASLSLSQVRAYEQVQSLAKREALINTITSAIRSSLIPKDIFAAITQQLGEALQVDGCALSLWTEKDEYVQCVGLYEKGRSSVVRSETVHSTDHSTDLLIEPIDSSISDRSLPRSVVPILGNPVHQQILLTQAPVVIKDLEQVPELNMLDIPAGMDPGQEQFVAPSRALLVVPLLSDGKIIGSISLRHNHTPRRWLASEIDLAQAVAAQAAIAVQQSRLYQTTRQQAERLLELDRLKTEFFQNISHEFRTPLTLTIGPLESAVQHQKDLPYNQAAIALRNCRRLLRLVNQLLNLQRLDAGQMQPRFRPCNFIQFVEQTVETFRPYCEKKEITVETKISDCPPLYLDLEKFDKVLYNLLSNAMKFTPNQGKITVCLEKTGNYCILQVKDTGIGIRHDQIPHLFDRFRQAEGSVSRSYEGSGLGLALAKELVELHGGQITVESVYEQGSNFTVWIPLGRSHLPPDQIIEVPTGVMPSRVEVELADLELETEPEFSDPNSLMNLDRVMTLASSTSTLSEIGESNHQESCEFNLTKNALILMVDDNPDLRQYVAGILIEQGYRTVLARNGAEGFQMAQKHLPDLIVADLMMPLVSGLDMIRMIRESENLKGIPIILLTAKVDEDTRLEGVEKGADAYLGKPFNDRELLAQVHNLLALKENERRIQELNTYLTESVLKRFLPPAMVQKAARGELQLDLSPEPRLITILFSDIVGFTQMSNNLRSRRVAEVLNEYLAAMTEAVFEHGGTVDKFVGDAIIAIFGAPEECTPNNQVKNAIAAARKMQRALKKLNQIWQEKGLPEVKFRCGIHQGTAVVGMFGNSERSDYTAIGPSVNIAARLQEAANPNSILVSAAVADYLEDDRITKFKPLKLKGIDETVLTFLLGD